MSTVKILGEETDVGKFELLATSVLRKHSPEYATILHTGINADGKTVRSPLDGFSLIPHSDPPHFLMVEHTTTKIEDLEKKWLHDHTTVTIRKSPTARKTKLPSESDDGDLIKAGREAEEIRKSSPNALFTLILTTNQMLSVDLLNKVYERAKGLDVAVDPWGPSRLADFLDTTTEGHYLRKMYLGIEVEMLSLSLLHEICQKSLLRYEQELLLVPPGGLVSRELLTQIQQNQQNGDNALQLLIGGSGSGKSVLAYQSLQDHLNSDRYGLWFPAELIENCVSLENAIDKVLRVFYPSLLPNAGQSALQFFQKENKRFFIVVDDLNRVEAPSKLLRKLSTWAKPMKLDSAGSQQSLLPFLIICPVWPTIWGTSNTYLDKTTWVNSAFIEAMTLSEAQSTIQMAAQLANLTITRAEANTIAERLGRDPILVGLYSNFLLNNQQIIPEDVIEQFIADSINKIAATPDAHYLATEYQEALNSLALRMLQNRNLYPRWSEIRAWFQVTPDQLNPLRELTQQGYICHLTTISGEQKFSFRHDRIQQSLLIKSVVKLLEDSSENTDLLFDPYFAEIVGQAILLNPQPREFLKQIRERLPLALIVALQYLGIPSTPYHQEIIEEIREWINSLKTDFIPASVLNAICWTLLETDSTMVLDITEKFPKYWSVLLARLRNGCTKSGILYCSRGGDSEFRINNTLRDQIIEHAKQRHAEKLILELKHFLTDTDISDKERRGALALVGFLKTTDCHNEISVCWELATDKSVMLADAIWATTRCCNTEPDKLLDPMMVYWANLPDEEGSLKYIMAHSLRFGLRDTKRNVIDYFIEQCNIYESLRGSIAYLCGHVDLPNALEFALRWVVSLHDNWDGSRGRQRLSQTSRFHLKTLWDDPNNDKYLRRRSFLMWLTSAGLEEIEVLRAISSDSPLFRDALRKRTQLGDDKVVPDLCKILRAAKKPSFDTYWFDVAHYVWCEELMEVAEHYLGSFKDDIPPDFSEGQLNSHWHLSRLLMMIPKQDAEMLLAKYWSHLGYSRLFIQAALYIGTPKCLKLADSSIEQSPSNIPIFELLMSHFGYSEVGRMDYFTADHIKQLQPYLDRLDESTLGRLAEACQRFDMVEWSQQYLAHRLNDQWRRRYHPTNDDLLQDLDEFAADEHYSSWQVQHWLEDFDRRHDSKDRALPIMKNWLRSNLNLRGLQIVAACIESIGTRDDLSILDQYGISGPEHEIDKVKASTRFAVYRRSLN